MSNIMIGSISSKRKELEDKFIKAWDLYRNVPYKKGVERSMAIKQGKLMRYLIEEEKMSGDQMASVIAKLTK